MDLREALKFTHHWEMKMILYPIGGSSNDNAVSFVGTNVDRRRGGNEETGSLFGGKSSWAGQVG